MIGALVQILFAVVLMGVIWWGVQKLLPLIPMGEPFRTIVYVLCVIILVIIVMWIIWQLLVISGLVSGRPFRLGGGIADRTIAAISASPARHLQGWG